VYKLTFSKCAEKDLRKLLEGPYKKKAIKLLDIIERNPLQESHRHSSD
jgi:mRNA-degrading endonuclease RelE of RelBE toxin-antitoxin system